MDNNEPVGDTNKDEEKSEKVSEKAIETLTESRASENDDVNWTERIKLWCKELKNSALLIDKKPSSAEPFKFIYQGIKNTKNLRDSLKKDILSLTDNLDKQNIKFYMKFLLVHIYSSLAKWNELCEELSEASEEHKLCISVIEKLLEDYKIPDKNEEATGNEINLEIEYGLVRCRYMLIYELTRYAILCSERDDQEKALSLLKRAEEFYHKMCSGDKDQEIKENWPLLYEINSFNSKNSSDMFIYVLFYLGQAYRISGDKEKAVLYLHMVLRKQLEAGGDDFSAISWSNDTVRMSGVIMINIQSFDTARTLLAAANYVLGSVSSTKIRESDDFKEAWGDLGRAWMKLGLELLDASCDRLKDLEEQARKPPKFNGTLKLTSYEKLSLGLSYENRDEFDTLLLIKSLKFPTLDLTETLKSEMPGHFARDFDEARAIFLPLQRWFKVAKEYYIIDEFAGDYIDLVRDYCNAFKYLVFFESDIERQIKMQRRRINLLEELLSSLNPAAYQDIFHYVLKDLAEIYESVYKLKVCKIKERGESLLPKDHKLVKLLTKAVDTHKKHLATFGFDIKNCDKSFPAEYEKNLLGIVLSVGRILAYLCHDHPLNTDVISFAEDGKEFYKYFIQYLDRRPQLKEEFKVLYDGCIDFPDVLNSQIDRIRHRQMTLQ